MDGAVSISVAQPRPVWRGTMYLMERGFLQLYLINHQGIILLGSLYHL